jgi:hypothetical protein
MSVLEDMVKAIQAVVVPELKALNEKLDAFQRENNLRLDALRNETQLRFDGVNHRLDELNQRLALERRIAAIELERDEKRQ